MWSMAVVLTETENDNDSQNQCKSSESMQHYVILQNDIIVMMSWHMHSKICNVALIRMIRTDSQTALISD